MGEKDMHESELNAAQPARRPKKKKRGRAGKVIRKTVKIVVVLVLAVGAGLFGLKAYIGKQAEENQGESYSRAAVTRGAMEETVYGTGTTAARNQTNVLAGADGTLTDLRVSVGDEVKAGDILAVLTNADLDDEITDLEFDLWELDDTILDTSTGSKVTAVEAPAAGRVMAVYAGVGDDALAVFRREGALAVISTDGRMKVELSGVDAGAGVALNDKLAVTGENFTAEGTVVDLTRQGTSLTLTIQDDSLPMGETVSVATADGVALGTGTLAVNKPMAVSSYGGTIESVRTEVGKTVKRGDTLFKLTDSPITLKLENLRLQRETASKSLEDAKERRENLIVLAPCDGTIATLDVSEGDEIASGALMCSILEGEDMNLTIAVDELDVVEVAVGQKVKITVDALSDAEIDGEVYKIAPVGSNSGGVTTYDVELTFDAAGSGVRSGMNATGEITVASAENTLYVPVKALMTIGDDTYLMVESSDGQTMSMSDASGMTPPDHADVSGMTPPDGAADGGQSDASADGETTKRRGRGDFAAQQAEKTDGNALTKVVSAVKAWLYEGVNTDSQPVSGTLVKVETGMQNDDSVEILSGVSEGDVVLYTASSTSTSSGMMMGMSMMSMGGGSGGSRGGNGGMGGGPGGF